jgi:hypothetical protein
METKVFLMKFPIVAKRKEGESVFYIVKSKVFASVSMLCNTSKLFEDSSEFPWFLSVALKSPVEAGKYPAN